MYDAVTLEVLWNRVIAICEEQARSLFNASFSTIVGESEDFASALYDARGNLLAQAASSGTVGMMMGMTKGIKAFLRKIPAAALQPGDALIANDPWLLSGHKYDVTIASPVFRSSVLIGFTATTLHATDIGGIGFSAASRQVFDEGLTIPIMKIVKAGTPNEELLEIIRENVREPDQVIADFFAQLAANTLGSQKLLDFMSDYDLPTLEPLAAAIVDRTEQAMRAAIAALPDGVFTYAVDFDGYEAPLRIVATVRLSGDEMTVDFSGTSPQAPRGINSVLNVTTAYTVHAIKCALAPEIPNTEGTFRPIRVLAPEGCLLNARRPAAVMARHVLVLFISAAVFGALAQAVPEKVIAESGHRMIHALSGVAPSGEPFIYWFLVSCGVGATAGHDGLSGTNFPAAVGTVPVEMIETVSPVFIEKKELLRDSGGPGTYRGGCDQEVVFRIHSREAATLSAMYDRLLFPARGYAGGGEGRLGRFRIRGAAGERAPGGKERCSIAPGETVAVCGGGGGGYGPAEQRDPERVRRDVEDGLVSPEAARAVYRVVLDPESLAINWQATKVLRSQV